VKIGHTGVNSTVTVYYDNYDDVHKTPSRKMPNGHRMVRLLFDLPNASNIISFEDDCKRKLVKVADEVHFDVLMAPIAPIAVTGNVYKWETVGGPDDHEDEDAITTLDGVVHPDNGEVFFKLACGGR
jgi:hypothetical protein